MFMHSLLAILAASTAVSGAPTAKHVARDVTLQPWQVTKVFTHSPSGREGTSPYSTLNATIHDPNTIDAAPSPTGEAVFPSTTAQCTTQWLDSAPWGKYIPCSSSDDEFVKWSFKLVKPNSEDASPTTNFILEFKWEGDMTVVAEHVQKEYTGSARFGGNNLEGACGASGTCSWNLQDSASPVEITPKLQSS